MTLSNSAGNPIDAIRPALGPINARSPRFAPAHRWLHDSPSRRSSVGPEAERGRNNKGMEAPSRRRSRGPMVSPEGTAAYSSRNGGGTTRNRSGPVPSRAARRRHSGGTNAEPDLRRFRYKVRGVGPRAARRPHPTPPLAQGFAPRPRCAALPLVASDPAGGGDPCRRPCGRFPGHRFRA